MGIFKSALVSYVLPTIGVLFIVYGCSQASNNSMNLCKHQYALCTSAICVPKPGDPTKAVCFCAVEEGASMASAPCETLMPSTDANGIQTVYSTFSLEQFSQGKLAMKCPAGTPWTWCLNKRCTVDPYDSKKAICICDVKRTGEWMTLGGNCDTSTCATGYWSGAPMENFAPSNEFMTKALGLKESVAKWCPANTTP